MAKRKRNRAMGGVQGDQKRQKVSGAMKGQDPVVKQAILTRYYPKVFCLREYLISKLPATSKIRKKKINSIGRKSRSDGTGEDTLCRLLDTTLIGVGDETDLPAHERLQQWTSFSQRMDTSDLANLSGVAMFSQSEIVDFAIWLLFQKSRGPASRVQHLLCQGFRKDHAFRNVHQSDNLACAIPGVVSSHVNQHVIALKAAPWSQILSVLGREGEKIMIDLILDCGIYVSIERGQGTYHQLSGKPLGDLQILDRVTASDSSQNHRRVLIKAKVSNIRSPASIAFVRNRMLYGRAALNARGGVRFGLRHIHVLNRFPLQARSISTDNHNAPLQESTLRMLMYIFPRQFGLHNVFTHNVDSRETIQPFKDYTLREDEIKVKFPLLSKIKIPKRLRGTTVRLVEKFQVLHSRCAYKELLEYYCPILKTNAQSTFPMPETQPTRASTSSTFKTQIALSTDQSLNVPRLSETSLPPRKNTLMDHATPDNMVSAFARSVLSNLIPNAFWGTSEQQSHNKNVFDRNVDRFIRLRRFENLSLHEVSQSMKINSMDWLGSSNTIGQKLSHSDTTKRWELLHEFLYYVFDSILIPLIRANFHVTESNVHKYRLFYFRHDVWKSLAEPAIATLKTTMFEEVKLERAQDILSARTLGFSQVRLLPKETGIRPIMNLRRRPLKKGQKNMLGSSINSLLTPIYNALTFEKTKNPHRLGSALFSVGDLYKQLTAFKANLHASKPLFFAKVDVKTAFDTIPQAAVVKLMSCIPTESSYSISRHVEIKPGDGFHSGNLDAKPVRKWIALAKAGDDQETFDQSLKTGLAAGRKNTIFIDRVGSQSRHTDELLALLTEHIQQNIVKIGKKFYRQKEGIPQGSILSSLLCNYFYADLEAKHLGFLKVGDSLLLRLIDDFLLITVDRSHAKRFLKIMHDGVPAYGVKVNPDKTLVNFEATINDMKVPRLVETKDFPYCGNLINTKSLNITRDRQRRKDMPIADSLTVEFARIPGKTFHRKVLNTFKIQSHIMYLDTSHNSLATVLSNLYSAFTECALKMWTYYRLLPTSKKPSPSLLISTLKDLIELAFVLCKSKGRNRWVKRKDRIIPGGGGFQCAVNKVQVEWLAVHAFREVLKRRQSAFTKLLSWCEGRIEHLNARHGKICERMEGIVITQANTVV